MRQGAQGNRRPRGRGAGNRHSSGGSNSGGGRSRVYESNGPVGRVRGNAAQVTEKYENLAKDAASAGDVVLYQNYLQHAEHYRRLLASLTPPPQPKTEKPVEDSKKESKEESEAKKQEVKPEEKKSEDKTKEEKKETKED